jgi:hypothetical protein
MRRMRRIRRGSSSYQSGNVVGLLTPTPTSATKGEFVVQSLQQPY